MSIAVHQSKKDRRAQYRRRLSAAHRRARDKRENSTRRELRSFWVRIERSVLSELDSLRSTGFPAETLFARHNFEDGFRRIFIPQIYRTLFFGIAFEDSVVKTLKPEQQALEIVEQVEGPKTPPAPHDIDPPPGINVKLSRGMQRRISGFLRRRSVGVWHRVSVTMRDNLAKTISKSFRDGEPYNVLAERIRKKLRALKRVQPMAIARTETTLASSFGGQLERDELGIPNKEWISTIDFRNRGFNPKSKFDHYLQPGGPDGQVVLNTNPFQVSGEFLMYPADSSLGASAGNVIQCRCAAAASSLDLI